VEKKLHTEFIQYLLSTRFDLGQLLDCKPRCTRKKNQYDIPYLKGKSSFKTQLTYPLRNLLKQFIFKVQKITANLLSYDHIFIYSKKKKITLLFMTNIFARKHNKTGKRPITR